MALSNALTRRTFVQGAALAVGAASLMGFTGCASESPAKGSGGADYEGDWRSYRCIDTVNCSATCASYALVKDGVVVRSRTDESAEDSWECPQQRGCVRGANRRSLVYAADRLKYPMKRKSWQPGGEQINGELRGIDEWERLSWDEALDMIVSEIQRIRTTYGDGAIFLPHYDVGSNRVLSNAGGFLSAYGTGSQGGWHSTVTNTTGIPDVNVFWDVHLMNDRLDLMNSKLIVLWGANPAWSSHGYPNMIYREAKNRGIKIICIDPVYTNTASALADQWIPIRPCTDTTMLLAMAYTMIDENLQDQDFLDTYTVGFDADHMPEGEDPAGNFKDYILGTYDGLPKTPEWASAICGVDGETIKGLAREIATTKPLAFLSGAAPARQFRGEQYAHAFLTVGWMTGNVGKPGSMVADNYHIMAGNGGGMLVSKGGDGLPPAPANPICNAGYGLSATPDPASAPEPMGVSVTQQWTAILTGEYNYGGETKTCDIHMIYDIGAYNTLNQQPGTPNAIRAYRKMEFVVASDSFLTPSCQYADIVLPVKMSWERRSTGSMNSREVLTLHEKVIDPLYESETDVWIEAELAKRLGVNEAEVWLPEEQRFYNSVAGSVVMKEDGTGFETLFTITEEDIAELGAQGTPQEGKIAWQDFKKEGIYKVRRTEGDKLGYIAFEAFIKDPVANPLNTETGKFEIFSRRQANAVAAHGSYTVAPIAQYIPPTEGWESTYADLKAGVKGEYPLQVITAHYVGRMHSHFDNFQAVKESLPHEIFINPIDAKARGIANGDTVKVYNKRGAVARQAKVTRRIMPGVIILPQGGWVNIDPETGVDLGGCANMLTRDEICGSAIQPFNSVNAQVEKWDRQIEPDFMLPLRIVELEA